MGRFITDKFKEFADVLYQIDQRIGFGKFRKYTILFLVVLTLVNYRVIVKDVVGFILELEQEIHADKMSVRDDLNAELNPLLVNFRAEAGADRILFYAFHNTKEDVLGIPFKYFELILQDHNYETPGLIDNEYSEEGNTGYIVSLYSDLIKNKVVICHSENDIRFRANYSGVFELFHSNDSCRTYVFATVPGVDRPIGFIVLEWVENGKVDSREEIIENIVRKYIPRMNALIVAASKK